MEVEEIKRKYPKAFDEKLIKTRFDGKITKSSYMDYLDELHFSQAFGIGEYAGKTISNEDYLELKRNK
jgi:hypothetical protein